MTNESTPDPNDIRYVRNYVLKAMRNIASRPEEGREYARQILWSITEGQLVEGFPPVLLERAKIALSLVRRGKWKTPWGYLDAVSVDDKTSPGAGTGNGQPQQSSTQSTAAPSRARVINNNYINYNKNNNLDINSEEKDQGRRVRVGADAFAHAVADWRRKLGMPDSRQAAAVALHV